MKRTTGLIACFFALLPTVNQAAWFGNPYVSKASMTIKVVDEAGMPVSNALVGISFSKGEYDYKKDQSISTIHEGETDTNGIFSASDKLLHPLRYGVRKDGYYRSSGMYAFDRNRETKKWDPPYATNTVVLKRIKNPIPMYVKKVEVNIPIEDQPVGFDLEKGDWINPYGEGARSDFLFSYRRNLGPGRDYEISLSAQFTNQVDGIQKYLAEPVSWQSLRLPHEAPEIGYVAEWHRNFGLRSGKYFNQASMENNANYFFRIRTEVDDDGNITNALYGKIYGEIDTVGHKIEKPILKFTYYLNLTPNDRNVEFDPGKNLSGDGGFAP